MPRNMRNMLFMSLLGLSLACGSSLEHLKAYHPVGPRLLQQPRQVHLTVTTAQKEFVFDGRVSIEDAMQYVSNGLAMELRNSGMEVVESARDGATEVQVNVEQVDMGYKLFYWWYGVGYSMSETVATVQLNVTVEVPGSGRRYLRRFAGYESTNSGKFWVYFIPIPFKVMTAEPDVMLRAAQSVFSQVAQGVAEIHLADGGR